MCSHTISEGLRRRSDSVASRLDICYACYVVAGVFVPSLRRLDLQVDQGVRIATILSSELFSLRQCHHGPFDVTVLLGLSDVARGLHIVDS